ncbi:hypothetical protein O181_072312 [Austropuccinia psidii MF-1]|uniref:Uncharacterized protein n=1 Tax=Austropuccinia psidii MF-1 TaxID=1389203 RepID=A0A9Q3F6X6_9BASI|nr:hypothetical protein [Austropuccinia psidii MF-1]
MHSPHSRANFGCGVGGLFPKPHHTKGLLSHAVSQGKTDVALGDGPKVLKYEAIPKACAFMPPSLLLVPFSHFTYSKISLFQGDISIEVVARNTSRSIFFRSYPLLSNLRIGVNMSSLKASFTIMVFFFQIVLSPNLHPFYENNGGFLVPGLIPFCEPSSFETPNASRIVPPFSENANFPQGNLQTLPIPNLSPLVIEPHQQVTPSNVFRQLEWCPIYSPETKWHTSQEFGCKTDTVLPQQSEELLDARPETHDALLTDNDQNPIQIDLESSSDGEASIKSQQKLGKYGKREVICENIEPESVTPSQRHERPSHDKVSNFGYVNRKSQPFKRKRESRISENMRPKRPDQGVKRKLPEIDISTKKSIYAQLGSKASFPRFKVLIDGEHLSIEKYVRSKCEKILASFLDESPPLLNLSPRSKKLLALLEDIGRLHCFFVEVCAPKNNKSEVVLRETDAFFLILNDKILNRRLSESFFSKSSTPLVDLFHKAVMRHLDSEDGSHAQEIVFPVGQGGRISVTAGKLDATIIAGYFLKMYLQKNEQKFDALFPKKSDFLLFLQKLGKNIQQHQIPTWRRSLSKRPLNLGPLPWLTPFNEGMMKKGKGQRPFNLLLTSTNC